MRDIVRQWRMKSCNNNLSLTNLCTISMLVHPIIRVVRRRRLTSEEKNIWEWNRFLFFKLHRRRHHHHLNLPIKVEIFQNCQNCQETRQKCIIRKLIDGKLSGIRWIFLNSTQLIICHSIFFCRDALRIFVGVKIQSRLNFV